MSEGNIACPPQSNARVLTTGSAGWDVMKSRAWANLGVHFDKSGQLWVERTTLPGERRLADVYDPSGELVMRVSFPAGLRLMYGVLRPDLALGVMIDEFDVQYVARVRVP